MIVLPAPESSARKKRMRGRCEKVVVGSLELVRQRVNASDGQGKMGVVLVGEGKTESLNAQPETTGVPVEGLDFGRQLNGRELCLR